MRAKPSNRKPPGQGSLLAGVFAMDLRALALFRAGMALFILFDLYTRAGNLGAHYTDAGVFPRSWATQYFLQSPVYSSWNPAAIAPHFAAGGAPAVALIFLIHAVAAIGLLIGYRTRFMTFIVWFLMASLHARNPLVLSVGDDVTRLLLFFAMFLHLGARYSVDARQAAGRPEGSLSSPATAAFYGQFICIYFFAALLKNGPEWRSEGTALYYAFHFDQFATPLAKSLLGRPGLLRWMTFAAWWVELAAPLLLLVPRRSVKVCGVLLLAGLQVGIGMTLELGHNPWINLIALLPFIPTWKSRPSKMEFHWPRDLMACAVLVLVVAYNIGFPSSLQLPALALRLEQYWGMFAPAPNRDDGWYVVEGRLKNRSRVEAFRESGAVSYDKPSSAEAFYPGERWRRYFINIGTRDFKDFRLPFVQYICRNWNGRNTAGRHLEQVSLYFMREVTPPPGQDGKVEKLLFYEYACLP